MKRLSSAALVISFLVVLLVSAFSMNVVAAAAGVWTNVSLTPCTGNLSVASFPDACWSYDVGTTIYLNVACVDSIRLKSLTIKINGKEYYSYRAKNYYRYEYVSWTPSMPGIYTVEISAHDGTYGYSNTWTVTVNPKGEYVIYSSLGSGWERVVDVDNGEFKSCQNIQSWEPNGTAAQICYIQHAWGDWYYIRVAADTTYVLDVLNGGKSEANIGIYPFHGGDNQLWKFVFTGKYQNGYPCCLIVSKSGGYCLDVCGASLDLGANIQAYDRNDTAAQIFTLHPTNANYDPQIHVQSTDYWGKYSYCKGYTLKESGCGVFALVNALEYVTGHNFSDDEIRDVAQFAIDRGYRVAGNGTSKQLAVGYAEAYGNQYGFKVGTTYYYNSKTSENQKTIEAFNSVLDKGGAIYLSVTSSSGGHIVSIVDKRINNGKTEYLLVDSYPSANRLGSGVSSGYVTIDNQLDLHAIGNGKKIVTKGSLGYYTILPK